MLCHTISKSALCFSYVELMTLGTMDSINAIVRCAGKLSMDNPLRLGTSNGSIGGGDFAGVASGSATGVGTTLGEIRSSRQSGRYQGLSQRAILTIGYERRLLEDP